jgi:hypothetical protein
MKPNRLISDLISQLLAKQSAATGLQIKVNHLENINKDLQLKIESLEQILMNKGIIK